MKHRRNIQVGIMVILLTAFIIGNAGGQVTIPEDEVRAQTIPLYAGLDLDTGQVEHDPTVLTLILSDTGHVEKIAAPPIDPLFQFSPDSDVSIGLSAHPDTPFAAAAYRLNGLTVLEDTPLSSIDPAQLPTLPLNPPAPSVIVDANDLLVMQREDDRYALLGHIEQQPEIVNVRLTYWLETPATPTPPPVFTPTPEPPGAIPEPTTLGLLAVGCWE